MRNPNQMRPRRRGIAVLLTSVMIIAVMGIVGLAVDVGMMYAVKTKLSAAADAAALAGARAMGRAGSGGATAQATAIAYYNANITPNYMLANVASPNIPAPTTSGSVQTLTVTAQATLPLMFLRFLNNQQVINVSAQAQRRDVNLVMVLDRSGSMGSGAGSPCAEMVAAAQDFTNQFVDGRDNLGLVVFGGGYTIAYNLSTTFKSGSPTISSVIGTITCSGNTGSAQGLYQAYQMLKTLNQPGAINAIVFFTDGQPNGLTADWPIATQATPQYANSSGSSGSTTVSPWKDAYPVSGCSASSITGVIARNGQNQSGIYGMVAATIGTESGSVSASGCAFASGVACKHHNGTDTTEINQGCVDVDVAYIPPTDHWENSTSGFWDNTSLYGGAQILTIPSGPYQGKPMLDSYTSLYNNDIDLASMNAAESAAYRARSDSTVPIVIFAIGLGGATDSAPDQFLQHVANTLDSSVHSSHASEPTGKYIYVTGAGQLGAAFQEVASFVQRLSS